ncbi:MAG: hypothetical protein ACE5IC_02285 [Candidatus Brocadiales bacterium]
MQRRRKPLEQVEREVREGLAKWLEGTHYRFNPGLHCILKWVKGLDLTYINPRKKGRTRGGFA